MKIIVLASTSRRRFGIRLVCVCLFAGCASLAGRLAEGQLQRPMNDPAANRDVQAIPLQSSTVDGQLSWIIEPDVPRIPKIPGLDPQLPPHIERRLSYAFDLAQRGATYTADAEFRAVLGLCALEMDAREGGTSHREALREGLIAVHEADQFGGEQLDWRDAADVRSVATSHVTPVLAGAPGPVDSIKAVQAYYMYAEQRLAYACQGLPGASLAYYGWARTIVLPGSKIPHASGKAALLQRVALAIAPQNVLAANELGVLLAQHGQLDDAEKIFKQCVATDATPETWRNLAVVYARQGNENASRSALAAGDALAADKKSRAIHRAEAITPVEGATTEPNGEQEKKPSFLSKFNLTPKLPSMFHR
jgi:tetratricopeptide (TPR) repeat protein